jgi:hypothetical protein
MIMTENRLSTQSTEELMHRKRELENGLAAASMHGVEVPEELVLELRETQTELSKRMDFSPPS